MSILIVIENPKRWPLHLGEGVEIVAARSYLTDPKYAAMARAKVFNMCRSLAYQSAGYYVSLLASARDHRPMPSIATIQDMKLAPLIRIASKDLDHLIQTAFRPLRSGTFDLSIYFGRNMTARYDRLALALFNQFPAPFLRATFTHDERWILEDVRVIGTSDIPEEHRPFVIEQAKRHFDKPPRRTKARAPAKYDLAILRDESEPIPPSDEKAIRSFIQAGEAVGFRVQIIGKDDYGRIAEFDALFIRSTTAVNNFTYRFARRARAEGLMVIDDPESIVRCTNKVFLAELLDHHELPTPKAVIISRDTIELVAERIGFPCVIKQPDSSFSVGVEKFDTQEEFTDALERLFEQSDLLLAQEFVPTDFDWRIGVLGGEPLFACKYFMARKHWQIYKHENGQTFDGESEVMPIDKAPKNVVALAVRAAKLMGNGLYGVDLKVLGGRPRVIEVNDNPSIDSGVEDRILGRALYEKVMRHFMDNLDQMRK